MLKQAHPKPYIDAKIITDMIIITNALRDAGIQGQVKFRGSNPDNELMYFVTIPKFIKDEAETKALTDIYQKRPKIIITMCYAF